MGTGNTLKSLVLLILGGSLVGRINWPGRWKMEKRARSELVCFLENSNKEGRKTETKSPEILDALNYELGL